MFGVSGTRSSQSTGGNLVLDSGVVEKGLEDTGRGRRTRFGRENRPGGAPSINFLVTNGNITFSLKTGETFTIHKVDSDHSIDPDLLNENDYVRFF